MPGRERCPAPAVEWTVGGVFCCAGADRCDGYFRLGWIENEHFEKSKTFSSDSRSGKAAGHQGEVPGPVIIRST